MIDTQAYHVKWFVAREAQIDVTVRIGDGRLLGVEPGRTHDAIELGCVALVEGLVNAHTHLEFSDLSDPISTTGRFTDWIRAVVAHRHARSRGVGTVLRSGLRESLEFGTTLLGDIATDCWSWNDYAEARLGVVVFQEILGLTSDRIESQKEIARSHANIVDRPGAIGISPHAPYSTHLELVREAVTLAVKTGCRLAMHLAETRAELDLLANGTGEFREMLKDFGAWRDDRLGFGRRPMDYLKILADAPSAMIVHGNYLEDDELKFLATQPQITLVYCPRTHAAFGHSEHPWRRARELGVRVALGTDSRASNPDLSVFAELQFLAEKYPDVSQVDLLQLGSIEGRRALGDNRSTAANFTLIRLAESSLQNPERELLMPTHRICGTMINGRWAWSDADLIPLCPWEDQVCRDSTSTSTAQHKLGLPDSVPSDNVCG